MSKGLDENKLVDSDPFWLQKVAHQGSKSFIFLNAKHKNLSTLLSKDPLNEADGGAMGSLGEPSCRLSIHGNQHFQHSALLGVLKGGETF